MDPEVSVIQFENSKDGLDENPPQAIRFDQDRSRHSSPDRSDTNKNPSQISKVRPIFSRNTFVGSFS